MRSFIYALVVAVAACLAAAAAAAADPGPIQVSGQSAGTSQQATAASSATQVDPSNKNISIRVLSPGNDGAVSQSNNAASSAAAGNLGSTSQSANQAAGGSGIQSSQQAAGTDQVAAALSAASQYDPSNKNVAIRVLSPGNDAVEQRRFTCRRRQRCVDDAVGLAEPGRVVLRLRRLDADPDVRPVGVDGSNGSRTLGREADRSVEHERLGPRAQPR